MPLLKLIFPSNTEYVLNMLIDLSNFEMIPANKILKKIFSFLNDIKAISESNDE